MNRNNPRQPPTLAHSLIERAEARVLKAEARTEQARTRAECAEMRAEQAETRTEFAKTRTEQAEIRTEQAETRAEHAESALETMMNREIAMAPIHPIPVIDGNDRQALEQLTLRQREVLQHLAAGQNTKQIASSLALSPKTVEYHRLKLMAGLNIHDVTGLVRFALRVGVVSPEG